MSDPAFTHRYLGSVREGLWIAARWNIGIFVAGVITIVVGVGAILIAGFGLLQLFWLVPFWYGAKDRGETETAKGILLGLGITFLLSAACWGTLTLSFSR
ncbi:MAG TPA: hypothetical protein VHC72_13005 [Bryobacteraceae bacterium]|nr:hypothetical protein [Bryobacteraceae bacterium]